MVASSSVRHPITLGDKTYDVSPINDEGREALDEWVRAQYVARVTPIIAAMTSERDKEIGFTQAYKQAFSMSWMSGEGAKLMGTVEGVARLLYEGIRPNHPDVSYEQIRAEMFNPDNIRKANAAFRELQTRGATKATEKKMVRSSPKKRST